MDLHSELVNCSVLSTATEGKRNIDEFISVKFRIQWHFIKINCCSNFGGYPEIERTNGEEHC